MNYFNFSQTYLLVGALTRIEPGAHGFSMYITEIMNV